MCVCVCVLTRDCETEREREIDREICSSIIKVNVLKYTKNYLKTAKIHSNQKSTVSIIIMFDDIIMLMICLLCFVDIIC